MGDLPAARQPELLELASGDRATVVPIEHEGLVVLELVAHDADAGVIATLELTAEEAAVLSVTIGRASLELLRSGNSRGASEKRGHGTLD